MGPMPAVAVSFQVVGGVDEHLVDGVDMDILRGRVLEIDVIDARAVVHIIRHAGRGDDIVKLQGGIVFKLRGIGGFARKAVARGFRPPPGIDTPDRLHDLKQPRPPGNPVGFQRRRNRKADGLLRAALVRHDQIGCQRVLPQLPALDGGIEAFQINRDIGFLRHPCHRLSVL